MKAKGHVLVVLKEEQRPPRRDARALDVLAQLLGEPVLGGKPHDQSTLDGDAT